MKKKTNAPIFSTIQSGARASGPGPRQPPKKHAVPIPAIAIISMYSANRNEPKRIPPNSVLYPATSSESASGRSNGARALSANAATMKMQKPANCGTTNHMSSCDSTMLTNESEPAVITTPSSESPSDTSYEISCAAERIEPRNEYFEPDDQPPSRN